MAKKMVIVESPAKAKAIAKYLGEHYTVQASMGHVRDLPQDKFGVDVEHGFNPTYRILPRSRKVINALKKAVSEAEVVYLAPDPDREGEAIAWHLQHALGLPDEKVSRVTFNEITRDAVRTAFENPGKIDANLVDAQQARRILDRIVGYELSPLISRKIVRGLSAGRVQSVALRLICDRERQIRAFQPEEYWQIKALLSKEGKERFEAQLEKLDGQDAKISTEQEASQIRARLEGELYRVQSVKKRQSGSKAPPPFITSTMQQGAGSQLRFDASRTMRIAQQLYEGIDVEKETVGLISYMRTDSTSVSQQAIGGVRRFIETEFGERYLPARPNVFKSPRGAQAAHEAIRPTDVARRPEQMKKYLSRDQWRLYDLIWRRFVASQMTPAIYALTDVEVCAGSALFVARGRKMAFDGYTRVMPAGSREEDQILPALEQGEALKLEELVPSQHFTKPPNRYSEATLVKEMETQGIGRPSTYAPIIATLKKRHYVRKKGSAMVPTDLGMAVAEKLTKHFPREMDVGFTRQMEDKLDEIEEGNEGWRSMLEGFYGQFQPDLVRAREEMKSVSEDGLDQEVLCEKCGKKMLVRFSRSGEMFLGCSGFPECDNTRSLSSETEEQPEQTEHKCPKCGAPMLLKTSRRGRKYLACSASPECRTVMGLDKEGGAVELKERTYTEFRCPRCGERTCVQEAGPGGRKGAWKQQELRCTGCRWKRPLLTLKEALEQTELFGGGPCPECPECGKPMVVKRGRGGLFLGCPDYPQCRGTSALSEQDFPDPVPTYETCERCGRPLLLRWGKYGRFLGCSGFPRCRNTRQLSVPGSGARVVPCPRKGCDGTLVKKPGPDDKQIYGCTRYPECDYTCEELPPGGDSRKKKAAPRPRAIKASKTD